MLELVSSQNFVLARCGEPPDTAHAKRFNKSKRPTSKQGADWAHTGSHPIICVCEGDTQALARTLHVYFARQRHLARARGSHGEVKGSCGLRAEGCGRGEPLHHGCTQFFVMAREVYDRQWVVFTARLKSVVSHAVPRVLCFLTVVNECGMGTALVRLYVVPGLPPQILTPFSG